MRYWLTFCLLCLLSFTAGAEVAVPSLAARVTDLTGTLTAEQRTALETRLQAFETQKGSQIAVLIVATTQPEDIAQYSIRVVEQWKLGRKKIDDGVLLLVAKDDHKLRIEVGYGLEGVMPDVVAKRIIAEDIAPHFKQGDFYGGIVAGVTRIIAVVQGEALPAPQHQAGDDSSFLGSYFLFLLFSVLFGGLMLRSMRGKFPGATVVWRGRSNDGRNHSDSSGGFSGGGGDSGGGGASGGW